MQQQRQYAYSLAQNYAKSDIQKDIILSSCDKKLNEYNLENPQEAIQIVALLSKWRILLGIKEQPTGEETAFNSKFIIEEYPEMTISKLEIAIKLSIKGELNVDIKPYGAFSPLYISTIINAYRKYDEKVIGEILKRKHKEEIESNNKPREYTDEERLSNRIAYLEWYKKECVNGYLTDFKDIAWTVLLKNKKVDGLMLRRFDIVEQATKICEKEKLKKDLTKSILADEIDVEKVSKYMLMKDIIQTLDFNQLELL